MAGVRLPREFVEDLARTRLALHGDECLEGVQPLAGLFGVGVVGGASEGRAQCGGVASIHDCTLERNPQYGLLSLFVCGYICGT